MISWWLDPELDDAAGRAFATLERVFALTGERISKDPLSETLRVEYAGRRYYLKRYLGNGKNVRKRWFGLRQWFSPLRVETEWRNLLAFREWGIPTARPVAYGVERRYGGFRRGALITEEIRGTANLACLARQNDARLRDANWVARVSAQVARITRRLHAAGFAHNDLYWRNLLVSDGETPVVYLIDCPKGRFWWGPFLRYRIIRDLACLDKVARDHLTRTRRLRFYLDYAEHDRLSGDDKRCARRVSGFFEGRE
jgi:serine/threonine-protein kinase RIO1